MLRSLLLLPLVASCFAQDYRAKIQGLVSDLSGAALAGARVVLRNTGTAGEIVRVSGPDGRYVFDFVESGTYSIAVEAPGFKRFEQRSFVVQNRGDITIDARLALGTVSESITVEASPVQVNFNSSSDTLTVGRELIDQMPIRGRNPYNVATLDPTMNGGEAAENRPYHHAFANAADSEFGYSAGGIVILNMRSGTNRFKGSAYYHNRSPPFNAFGDPTVPRTAGANEIEREPPIAVHRFRFAPHP